MLNESHLMVTWGCEWQIQRVILMSGAHYKNRSSWPFMFWVCNRTPLDCILLTVSTHVVRRVHCVRQVENSQWTTTNKLRWKTVKERRVRQWTNKNKPSNWQLSVQNKAPPSCCLCKMEFQDHSCRLGGDDCVIEVLGLWLVVWCVHQTQQKTETVSPHVCIWFSMCLELFLISLWPSRGSIFHQVCLISVQCFTLPIMHGREGKNIYFCYLPRHYFPFFNLTWSTKITET